MGQETLGEVRRPSGRSGMDRGTLGKIRDGSGTLAEVRDRLRDPQGGPGWVGTP